MTLIAAAIRDKDLKFSVRVTSRISVGGILSIQCYCGRSVYGAADLVREAHRQHLLNHEYGRMARPTV